jgi:hypothetical protein
MRCIHNPRISLNFKGALRRFTAQPRKWIQLTSARRDSIKWTLPLEKKTMFIIERFQVTYLHLFTRMIRL